MMVHPLIVVVLIASLFGAVALVTMLQAVKKFRVLQAARNGIFVLLSFSVTALAGFLYIANHGYKAFTREVTAATVSISPTGQQQFTARFLFPDSTEQKFAIAGDQLYVDAHILKWHPLLNLIGIHTTYELDRVAGRYLTLDDERAKPRTVYSLSKTGTLNMFHLRKKIARLKPLLDAEYGSATFVGTEKTESVRITVSVSGLMVRNGTE
jgi:hypothetical protein